MTRVPLAVLVCTLSATALASSAGSETPGAGRIAFASDYPLPATYLGQVVAIGADGRGRRFLGGAGTFAYGEAALAPSGSRVAVIRQRPDGQSELLVIGVDGSGRRLVAAPPGQRFRALEWSPDGRVVALGVGGSEEFDEVWLARVDAEAPVVAARLATGRIERFDWSPAGDRLAVGKVSTAGCGPGIYKWCATWSIDVVGVGGRRLAEFEAARNAAWSPDGRWLAFERGDFTSLGEENATIQVARADGSPLGTLSALWPGDAHGGCAGVPSWSPDGRWLAYGRFCYGSKVSTVFVRRDGTSKWRVISEHWSWSPDGSRVLFVRPVRGRGVLFVSRVDGGGRRRVASRVREAAWSPRGAHVLYVRTVRRHAVLFAAARDGGRERRLTRFGADASLPVFANDAGRFTVTVTTNGSARIYRGDAGSARLVPLTREPGGSTLTVLGWSPDRETLVYHAWATRRVDLELWTMDPDGADRRRLTANARDDRSPVWSPDATTIAFVRDERRPGDVDRDAVLTIRADGRGERRLTIEPGRVDGLSWSPDGKRLAYDAGPWVVVAEVDAGARAIVRGRNPAWSPDGSQIAFEEGVGGMSSLRVVHFDGTGERTLVRTSDASATPAWSPDGTRIAFGERGAVRTVRPDGTGERTVAPILAASIRWSPDGSKLAIERDVCCGAEGAIFVVNADGTDLHIVGRSGAARPAWSPDGTRLVFDSPGAPAGFFRRLYVVDADGGNLTAITTTAATSVDADWRR